MQPVAVELKPEKLLAKLLKESWPQLLIAIIVAAFSIGVTYASMNAKIDVNSDEIHAAQTIVIQDKQELNDKLDRLDKKLDEINRYLRDHK